MTVDVELADLGLEPEAETVLDREHALRLARTLDLDDGVLAAGTLPLTWIWVWFTPTAATTGLRADGHPAGRPDGALAGLDRRMFIGGRLDRSGPLRLDRPIHRVSEIRSAEEKQGGSGSFVLVDVEHRYDHDGEVVLTERQNLMYRAAPSTPVEPVGPDAERDERPAVTVVPDERLLFRFSALTFNTHRIHYDLPYATSVEGYPGLVVHGPLTATLLAGLGADRLGRPLGSFSFRATSPTFAGVELSLWADGPDDDGALSLRAERADGVVVMTATAT